MHRTPPQAASDEIDVYVRTYTSLLRSSGDVPVRAFEEAHSYSNSSLHAGARDARPDVAAFAYSAARLPECMPVVTHIVMGQSHEQFEAVGMNVSEWARVATRGRRRPLRWDGKGTLAAFVTSTSDIDDLVPILTAYQIEWNKMHDMLEPSEVSKDVASVEKLASVFDVDETSVLTLTAALGTSWVKGLTEIAKRTSDLSVRLLNGSFAKYQRAALRWWSGIEPVYMRKAHPRSPPVYFVSSNTHSLANILGGYAFAHRNEILEFAQKRNPEGLDEPLRRALSEGDEHSAANLAYYLLRAFLHDPEGNPEQRLASVQRFDAESGLRSIESPGRVDVGAQLIELGKVNQDRLDPRVRVDGIERLAESDAIIVNIDYPLGMAAYHHLSRTAQGVGEIQGIYIMGKGATLNGRVGDVMIASTVYDEHSQNTYMFRNSFAASDVQPYLRYGTVLDNQKALTVRGTFLQNRDYVGAFYRDGYSVLEMEAGPYLSAIHEIVNPVRHPENEIVHLSNSTTFDTGFLHYASDTPYSRRQSLLSKSLSYFGVESTYACSIAIVRRIFENEIARLG
ncbi:MAG: hypothetical protein IPK60_00195 [Sandaracinaceae bacterium]|nr:hypothetical protein [Sandaracinaceae bacterium]